MILLPVVFRHCVGASDLFKVVISVALIAPLATCMGMPFPFVLWQVAASAHDFVPWAWGINGLASVISAVPGTVLAIEFGFTFVTILVVPLYGIAATIPGPAINASNPSPLFQ